MAEAPTGPPGSFSLFTCVYQECAENQSGMRPKLLSFWAHPALVLGPRQKGRGSPVTTPWLPRGFPVATPGAATTFVDRMPGHLVSEGNRLTRALPGIRVALALFAKPAGHQCQGALPWSETAPVFYWCFIAPQTAIKHQ